MGKQISVEHRGALGALDALDNLAEGERRAAILRLAAPEAAPPAAGPPAEVELEALQGLLQQEGGG